MLQRKNKLSKTKYASKEDGIFIHPENGLNELIHNWCIGGCWFTPAITVLDTNFFPIPPIKLKLGLQIDERLLIATHLDQSNYLAKQKQGTVK